MVDPGAVFNGAVVGGSGANTLELASGGSGAISGIGNGSFSNFGTVNVDTGATWTLSGAETAPTVVNNGTISVAGSLDVSTAIDPSSTGLFQLTNSASLDVAAALGTKTQISFATGSDLLIDNTGSFGTGVGTSSYAGPLLEHFGGSEADLKSFGAAGAALNFNSANGLLQLSNGGGQSASLLFQTSSLGTGSFHIASDGASGSLLTYS